MKRMHVNRRTVSLVAVLALLVAMLGYVALRAGPLATVPVTAALVERLVIAPAQFGIGTVEARHAYRIGPTAPGRIKRVDVNVGDLVRAGQVLGEMDSVDLDARIAGQAAAYRRAEAAALAAAAQVREAEARATFAERQAGRYDDLLESGMVSAEAADARQQEHQAAAAGLAAARANGDAAGQELARIRTDREGLIQQRDNLRLTAPAAGLVAARNADPGTTVVAGQAVVEVIDPASLWVNARFDQLSASGLRAELPARIVLRSTGGPALAARVERVEPLADAVTEETLAKVVFDSLPEPPPAVGALAEVTVELPALPASAVVPNASVQRLEGRLGVWVIAQSGLRFAPVTTGATDLDGRVQILDGLAVGERIVVYSARSLTPRSRIKVVKSLLKE